MIIIIRHNYRIQGLSFPYHWITKALIVICLVQQKILTNLHMLALSGPEFCSCSNYYYDEIMNIDFFHHIIFSRLTLSLQSESWKKLKKRTCCGKAKIYTDSKLPNKSFLYCKHSYHFHAGVQLYNLLIFLISFLLILTVVAEKRKTQNLSDKNANQSTSTATKKKPKTNKPEVEKVPSSDAILSCPACMTTLCIDCQRLVKHLELFLKIYSN